MEKVFIEKRCQPASKRFPERDSPIIYFPMLALFIFMVDEITHTDHANSVPNGDWNPGAKFWPRNFKVALKNTLLKTSILQVIFKKSTSFPLDGTVINLLILPQWPKFWPKWPKNSCYEVATLFTHNVNASGSRSRQRHLNKTVEFWCCSSTSVYIRFFQPFHHTGKMLCCIFLPKFALYHLALTSKSVC